MSFTWGELAFGTGTGWGGEEIQTLSVTGVEGTGATGSLATTTTNVFDVTGVAGTAAVGDETAVAKAVVEQTGLQLAAALGDDGTIADAVVNVTGVSTIAGTGASWGSDGFGEASFGGNITFRIGQLINDQRGLQSVEATVAVGSETIAAAANVSVTGVSTTAQLGDEYAYTNFTHAASGFEATASLGNEGTTAGAVVIEDGTSATGATGTPSLVCDANLALTGVSSTASLGDNADDEAIGSALVVETGLSAQARVSALRVTVTGNTTVVPTGLVGTTGEPKVTMWGGGSDDIPPEYTDAYREGFWATIAA